MGTRLTNTLHVIYAIYAMHVIYAVTDTCDIQLKVNEVSM